MLGFAIGRRVDLIIDEIERLYKDEFKPAEYLRKNDVGSVTVYPRSITYR
jgi:hypothetical protein